MFLHNFIEVFNIFFYISGPGIGGLPGVDQAACSVGTHSGDCGTKLDKRFDEASGSADADLAVFAGYAVCHFKQPADGYSQSGGVAGLVAAVCEGEIPVGNTVLGQVIQEISSHVLKELFICIPAVVTVSQGNSVYAPGLASGPGRLGGVALMGHAFDRIPCFRVKIVGVVGRVVRTYHHLKGGFKMSSCQIRIAWISRFFRCPVEQRKV